MFIIKLWRFCRGYLVISLSGRGVERLLNLAVARGIGFWDLQKQPGGARLSIVLGSFKQLRPLIRQTRCRLHILRKAGLPFWQYRLRRRRGLVVGVLFFCAALYLATAVVWFVRVTGTRHLADAEVLALAEELGIRPGVWKRSLDLPELEEALARKHGDIAWAGIRLRGVLVELEIVEHAPEPEIDHRPADLVAAKDGLVERLLVIEGEAVVAEGDTVAKGDLLIRGTMTVEDPALPPEEQAPPVAVRARGEVEARVWYEAVAPVNLTETVRKETGLARKKHLLQWSGGRLRLRGPGESPFDNYRQEVLKSSWRWRNLSFPVELITVIYYELVIEERELSPEKALQRARDNALTRLQPQLPEEASLEDLYFQEFTGQGRHFIRAVAETREDIAEIRLRQP